LAGVYTLAFLSVMALFAVGNMMLKSKRQQLPRDVRASWTTVWLALAGVLTALVGNLLLAPQDVAVFAIYYGVALTVVGVMLMRLSILRLSLPVLRSILESAPLLNRRLRAAVVRKIEAVGTIGVVYFTRGDALDVLNRAALYVLENEQTTRMKVVHVYGADGDIPPDLGSQLATLDRLYPPLRIDFLAVKGTFGPQIIEQLSRHLAIPKNLMFIGTPSDRFPHRIEELGGVRVIL
ncbi:MAG: APC family permease, partial [bacterium]